MDESAIRVVEGVLRRVTRRGAWVAHRGARPAPADAVAWVRERLTAPPPDDAPILVFAAAWRTGSTAVQRLLLDADVLLWGEPFGRAVPLRHLARTLLAFASHDWPAAHHFASARFGVRAPIPVDANAPNLYPDLDDLVAAHRALLDRLLAQPAAARGYRRWGVKLVRGGELEVRHLHLLYPHARFVFLVRDPVDAWRSYRDHLPGFWFDEWPSRPVVAPWEFARHWRDRAAAFRRLRGEVDGTLVRLEDLPAEVGALGRHLDLDLDPTVLDAPLGSTRTRSLPAWEARVVRGVTGREAARWGYGAGRKCVSRTDAPAGVSAHTLRGGAAVRVTTNRLPPPSAAS